MSTPPWGHDPQEPYQPYTGPGSPYSPYSAAPATNGMAVASLVVSLVGVVALCCYGVGGLIGLVGAILGHVSRKQIREQQQAGEGMALAGVIVGWITFGLGLLAFAAFVVLVIIGVTADGFDCYTDSNGVYVCD